MASANVVFRVWRVKLFRFQEELARSRSPRNDGGPLKTVFQSGAETLPRGGILRYFEPINGGLSMARITVEDCLDQIPNRFELVLVGARRAKQLLKGARPLVESDNKEVVTALREVAAAQVGMRYPEE